VGKVGDRGRGNFSRAFKAKYGIDPAAYRQAAGRGEDGWVLCGNSA
jgi:AraC-like DNA-binding protein